MASVSAAPFPVLHLMTSSSWPDGALANTSIPKKCALRSECLSGTPARTPVSSWHRPAGTVVQVMAHGHDHPNHTLHAQSAAID